MTCKFNEFKCKKCGKEVGVIGDRIPICHGYMVFTGETKFGNETTDIAKPHQIGKVALKRPQT